MKKTRQYTHQQVSSSALWVLENGTTPVDAGVFRVGENGGVRVEFKARSPIKIAGKFAVTEEVRGGAAAPTIKNMVLAGN